MTNESHNITMPSSMDIMAAEEIKQLLLEAINNAANIVVDAAKVERLTTPCIQLLIAFDQELKNQNTTFKITNASDAFINALEDVGLDEKYQEWSN